MVLVILTLPCLANDKSVQIDKLMKTYHFYNKFNGVVLITQHGYS
jgi:hypothetical protein